MSERSFYEERAKAAAKAAVDAVEAKTSAEIVVCLRGASDDYRDVAYLVGFVVSLGALVAMLFVDRGLKLFSYPMGALAGFLLGASATANLAPLRRMLVSRGRMEAAVALAARAAFVDQGASRTEARTGVLLYVSMFERRILVLPDVGIGAAGLGPEWRAAVDRLQRALLPSPDVERFLAAVKNLGPELARRLPRGTEAPKEAPTED